MNIFVVKLSKVFFSSEHDHDHFQCITLVKEIIFKHIHIHKYIIKQKYYIIAIEKIFTYERRALGICRYILALVTMSLPPSSRDPCLVEDEFPPRLITANAKSNRFIEFHLSTMTAATAFS